MVNHFASLLGNLDLLVITAGLESYLLSEEQEFILATSLDDALALDDFYTIVQPVKLSYPLINKDYLPQSLPSELQNAYNILFPPNTSLYYKHFLLYCYLRIIAAAGLQDHSMVYDKRITYDLDDFTDYFRFSRATISESNDPDFKILISGKIKGAETLKYYANNFVVRQIEDSDSVLVFSTTQEEYYKFGKLPSKNPEGMEITLSPNPSAPGVSSIIPVGDTGMYFSITGPFQGISTNFTTTSFKTWSFTVETPFNFDFSGKLKELENSYQLVDGMFLKYKESCNPSYEYLWRQHFNSVYRLAGLLLGYVERVNLVWQRNSVT
jgi:hypothetical protein